MAPRTCRPFARRARVTTLLRPARVALMTTACIGLWLSKPMAGGAGLEGSLEQVSCGGATPVALAAADFDEDGMPDLLSGYATHGGGVLTLHRGNVDALYPNTSAARERRRAGRRAATPFRLSPRAFALAGAPAFLHAGDFDADGHADVIAATQGGEAWLLRGTGSGSLGPAERIALPGDVTAMAVGDINGPDGLADVAFAIATKQQFQLLVFAGDHGAANAVPRCSHWPARALPWRLATSTTIARSTWLWLRERRSSSSTAGRGNRRPPPPGLPSGRSNGDPFPSLSARWSLAVSPAIAEPHWRSSPAAETCTY